MEKYISNTKIKCIILAIVLWLPVLVVVIFEPLLADVFEDITGGMIALRYIIFVLFVAGLIIKLIFYIKIIKNEEYANKQFILHRDERQIFIKQKVYNFEYKLILFVGGVALVATSFVSAAAFYTLFAVEAFVIASSALATLYYKKKY